MNNEYRQARISKDRNYDGKFFFGVSTTGIFCKPSCPAPTAKEENTRYFKTLFEAMEHGYRPCRRCRPDITLEYSNTDAPAVHLVGRALNLIYNGYLVDRNVADLAAKLDVSDRHLRSLFMDIMGLPPVKVAQYHKGVFAKKMLIASERPVTDIAFAAGFGSVRQFNEVMKKMFDRTPSEIREEYRNISEPEAGTGDVTLLLGYDTRFDFQSTLDFMRPRVLNHIEIVSDTSYARTFRTETTRGYFTLRDEPDKNSLRLDIHCDDVRCAMEIYGRVRRMFDLNTDFTPVNERFRADPLLSRGLVNNHVPRLPMAFDPFEFTVRAVLGQQITVKAASTLAARVAEKLGTKCPDAFPDGLSRFFPDAEEMLEANLDGLGITKTRQATLHTVARGVVKKTFSLSPNQMFEDFRKDFSALKGIGDWTVNYVAMRGLGMIDSFPASDLGIIKALSPEGKKAPVKTILKQAEQWHPYRAYAALCLWNISNTGG